jgi:hypothetical protein
LQQDAVFQISEKFSRAIFATASQAMYRSDGQVFVIQQAGYERPGVLLCSHTLHAIA